MKRTVIGWVVLHAEGGPVRDDSGGVLVFKEYEAAAQRVLSGDEIKPAVQLRNDRPAPRGRRKNVEE